MAVSRAGVATAIGAAAEAEEDEGVVVAEDVAIEVRSKIHTQAWQHDAVGAILLHSFQTTPGTGRGFDA